jgi:hypothetical protein
MTDKIGPTFESELKAAGVPSAVAWNAESGILYRCLGVSDADFAKAEAVLTAHDPTKPAPAAPPVVPTMVTNYQGRAALVQAGLFDKADAAIRGADQTVAANKLALQAWDYANNFYRDSAFISGVASILGLKPADIDALFVTAGAVQ